MSYWELTREQTALACYLPDAALSAAMHKDGIRPSSARSALAATGVDELFLQRLAADGDTVLGEQQPPMPDFLSWSWIPIFSAAGRTFCLRHGSAESDFLPCRFAFQDGQYYLHLPSVADDVIDLERSEFLMTIPVEPPLPFHVEHLVLRRPAEHDMFRATIPGHDQVLSELFVSDIFKRDWEASGLRGATFRPLTKAPQPRHRLQA